MLARFSKWVHGQPNPFVAFYVSKFADDEKWQKAYGLNGGQCKAFLAFAESWLKASEQNNLDDEYLGLKAMLEARLSFDADDK